MTLRTVEEAAALLRRGGIVVYPTETFYGLGALASRADALSRLATAKLRPEGKPLPLVAADLDQVRTVALLDDPVALALARRFWPGPLTLVVPAAAGLSPAITAGAAGGADATRRPTVGIRVPGSAAARELARAAGGPLVSTSANLSGGDPPASVAALAPALLARVDGVLDGGPTPGGLPSTVVAVENGVIRLVRDGAVPWAEVVAAAGETSAPGVLAGPR